MFCVKCGAPLPDDANFCFKCGCDLRNLNQRTGTSYSVVKVGDYVKFGRYHQNNGGGRKEPIEWLVLEVRGNNALLISRYGLDCKRYYSVCADMIWENCDLRKWLNGEFLSNAFSAAEQEKIAVTKLANDDNPVYGTFGGANTEDRVFLLSIAEADSLFKDDAARKCVQMSDAVGIRAFLSSKNFINGRACCIWWLRSPGDDHYDASYVDSDGALYPHGYYVFGERLAVRPAGDVGLSQRTRTETSAVKVGDYVKFGLYPQNNGSVKEPIEWLILEVDGNTALLISRYGLDCKQYHHKEMFLTWAECDLRKWLNGEFLSNAFSLAEQEKIAVTDLANDDNPKYGTIGGYNTEDRVFLLSITEAENLFKDNEARKCVPTPYAIGKGARHYKDDCINGRVCCHWWLRSPGYDLSMASDVSILGVPYTLGGVVNCDSIVVRPALRVTL